MNFPNQDVVSAFLNVFSSLFDGVEVLFTVLEKVGQGLDAISFILGLFF
jgi:hypothetical protein